jgi:hypothetical protein
MGKEKAHYKVPPSPKVPKERKKFIRWFNDSVPDGKNEMKKAPARSAIAVKQMSFLPEQEN